MEATTPTAPALPEVAKVIPPVASPEFAKPETSPPVADPTKAQPVESDKSAQSEPPKTDNLDDKAPRKSRYDELYARSKEQEARAVLAERRAEKVERELADIRQRFDTLPIEQQDFARMQAAVKTENLSALKQDAEDAKADAMKTMAEAFAAKVSANLDRMPGFWEKFNSIPLSEVASELVASSDKGAEVAYYLASNPDEAHRISRLPAHRQGAEIARIEGKITPAAQMRRVSQAPAPVPTLSGAAPSPAMKSPQEMAPSEFVEWFRKTGGR